MKSVKEKSFTKKVFTKKVLDYLIDTSQELLVLSAKIAFDPHSLMKGWGLYSDIYRRPYFSQRISNLKRSRYFDFKNGKFYLTLKGRIKIIREVIKVKKDKIRWDGRWRGIIFDIPELNRRDRRFLRNELKWIGFKELQKSIWVYPYNIEKELKTLLKLWKIDFSGDIRFILIDKIEGDKDLKKYFQVG